MAENRKGMDDVLASPLTPTRHDGMDVCMAKRPSCGRVVEVGRACEGRQEMISEGKRGE